MIYFICSLNDNSIKIGQSDSPWRRLKELQTGSPKPLEMLAVLPGGQKREIELHQLFREYHSRGEWFKAAPEIMDYIKSEVGDGIKQCMVCGALHVAYPIEEDIKAHSKLHKSIMRGTLPYGIREFMKEMAWSFLGGETSVEIGHHDDMKRVIVYAWWAREKELGIKETEFDDYVLDHMEYLNARFSGNKDKLKNIEEKLTRYWGKI